MAGGGRLFGGHVGLGGHGGAAPALAPRLLPWRLSEGKLFLASKLATLGWGAFAVAFSYQVERIAPTVLEAINKIGSMVNGSLLALFAIALLAPGIGQRRAVLGFFAGALCNLILWIGFPGVSWLWWNVSGFAVGFAVACIGQPVRLAPRLS